MNSWVLPASMAFLFWGLSMTTPKIALRYISPMSVTVYEGIGVLLMTVIVLIFMGFRPDVHSKGIMYAILTGILVTSGGLLFFIALKSGKLSVVTVFVAMSPVIPILFGYFVLKEPIALKEGIGMVFAFAAIVLFSI